MKMCEKNCPNCNCHRGDEVSEGSAFMTFGKNAKGIHPDESTIHLGTLLLIAVFVLGIVSNR
jgi:hypothetical protein